MRSKKVGWNTCCHLLLLLLLLLHWWLHVCQMHLGLVLAGWLQERRPVEEFTPRVVMRLLLVGQIVLRRLVLGAWRRPKLLWLHSGLLVWPVTRTRAVESVVGILRVLRLLLCVLLHLRGLLDSIILRLVLVFRRHLLILHGNRARLLAPHGQGSTPPWI